MLSNLVVTATGTLLVLAAGGMGLGLSYGFVVSDPTAPLRMAGLALVFAPAALALGALAALLLGWAPKIVRAAWGVMTAFFVLGWLGGVLQVPAWVEYLSPFTHTLQVPAENLTAAPLLWIALAVLLGTALGMVGFRRRDVG